jgi:Ca2+-transporting ATPase
MFSSEKLPRNKYLDFSLAGSFALQGLAMTVPGMRNLLGIGPISIIDGMVVAGSSALPLIVNEATKKIQQR